MGGFINNALAGAKKALADANNSSVGTKSGHSNFSKPQTHEYSQAPYGIASAARSALKKVTQPSTEAVHEAADTAAGIKSNMEKMKEVQ